MVPSPESVKLTLLILVTPGSASEAPPLTKKLEPSALVKLVKLAVPPLRVSVPR